MLIYKLKKKSIMHRSSDRLALPDAAELDRMALRRIAIMLVVGLLLIVADLISSWSTGNIEIVRDEVKDQTYLIRPGSGEAPGHLSLKARVRSKYGVYEKDLDLTLSPYREGSEEKEEKVLPDEASTEEERIMYELRSIASDVDSDRSMKKVLLPSSLPGGEKIQWSHRRQSHTLFLLSIMVISAVSLYRKRLSPIEKRRKEESESVLDCLPGFIHQLVLLMNAGLVLDQAFCRVIEENKRFRQEEDRPFYIKLRGIYDSIRETNASLTSELCDLASGSGTGEMMRVSSIIRDNAHKGTELIEKLERESASLWLGRKHRSEERGRLAETKMTLPLSIFLAVLILITVSPALLEL